jgi:hypothetical protein
MIPSSGVETKALNRGLQRNLTRFPADFVFQFTSEEAEFYGLTPSLTFKIQSIYCAYALDFDVYSFGGCFEEALNSLHEQMRARRFSAELTGEGGNA